MKLKLNVLKLSKTAWVTIVVVAIFAASIAAAGYYYYVIPHPAHLCILYTHSDSMVYDVVSDFKKWYGHPIEITLTPTDPQSAYRTVTSPSGNPRAEIWWGGLLSLFENASNHLLPYNSTQKSEIDTTVNSCPLMDLNQSTPHWYAASLHALGVMYNELKLKPQTWADLLGERYEENMTMVDPAKSESTQPFIMLIIQSQNWTKGWEYLVTLSAFIKDYDTNEANSALKVASGYLPIAIVPDFYAYEKMEIGIPNINFTYLDATVLQPDPIAIIKRGDYLKEAKAFINYILTQRAQNIIGRYRLPVRPDVAVTPPRINPFDSSNFPSILNYNKTFEEIGKDIVKAYYNVWITERHEQEPSIKTAWKEIEEANETSPYYGLAWNNFTMAGHYINRSQIDTIYNATSGWTETAPIDSYLNEWSNASKTAYSNAIENARKAKNDE